MLLNKFILSLTLSSSILVAKTHAACSDLPPWKTAREALIKARLQDNGGLNLDMWGSLVDRDGVVCSVSFTGKDRGDQWPGSRIISAQKAYTANAFSLPKLALSTANLFSAVQPGGSLFGLQHSNPIATDLVYKGEAKQFGQATDPLVGKRVGGVNVFGGGLALYNKKGALIGALGVSGDTSCADHNIAWRMRALLDLGHVPGGVAADKTDQIIYLSAGEQANGFKPPTCGGKENSIKL